MQMMMPEPSDADLSMRCRRDIEQYLAPGRIAELSLAGEQVVLMFAAAQIEADKDRSAELFERAQTFTRSAQLGSVALTAVYYASMTTGSRDAADELFSTIPIKFPETVGQEAPDTDDTLSGETSKHRQDVLVQIAYELAKKPNSQEALSMWADTSSINPEDKRIVEEKYICARLVQLSNIASYDTLVFHGYLLELCQQLPIEQFRALAPMMLEVSYDNLYSNIITSRFVQQLDAVIEYDSAEFRHMLRLATTMSERGLNIDHKLETKIRTWRRMSRDDAKVQPYLQKWDALQHAKANHSPKDLVKNLEAPLVNTSFNAIVNPKLTAPNAEQTPAARNKLDQALCAHTEAYAKHNQPGAAMEFALAISDVDLRQGTLLAGILRIDQRFEFADIKQVLNASGCADIMKISRYIDFADALTGDTTSRLVGATQKVIEAVTDEAQAKQAEPFILKAFQKTSDASSELSVDMLRQALQTFRHAGCSYGTARNLSHALIRTGDIHEPQAAYDHITADINKAGVGRVGVEIHHLWQLADLLTHSADKAI